MITCLLSSIDWDCGVTTGGLYEPTHLTVEFPLESSTMLTEILSSSYSTEVHHVNIPFDSFISNKPLAIRQVNERRGSTASLLADISDLRIGIG